MVGSLAQGLMKLRDLARRDRLCSTLAEARNEVGAENGGVAPRGGGLALGLDVLGDEEIDEARNRDALGLTYLLLCRVTASGHLAEQRSRSRAGLVGRERTVPTDDDEALRCRGAEATRSIAQDVGLGPRGRDAKSAPRPRRCSAALRARRHRRSVSLLDVATKARETTWWPE